jgi:hypothetical protein
MLTFENYLDLLRCELQAMTAFESAIQLRSRAKCCIIARAFAKFAQIVAASARRVPNSDGDRTELSILFP